MTTAERVTDLLAELDNSRAMLAGLGDDGWDGIAKAELSRRVAEIMVELDAIESETEAAKAAA